MKPQRVPVITDVKVSAELTPRHDLDWDEALARVEEQGMEILTADPDRRVITVKVD